MKRIFRAAAVAAALFALISGSARADDGVVPRRLEVAVCATLAQYPSDGGVKGILDALLSDGFSHKEAAEAVVYSVQEGCPGLWPVVQKFINDYSDNGTSIA